jgi:hypothetical protein
MRKVGFVAAIFAGALAAALLTASPASTQPNGTYGPCAAGWGGQGMMYGYPGGYGPGMMWGPGYGRGQNDNLNLSVNDVRGFFDRMLGYRANPHVKLGDVKVKDADTITAEIVTTNGSLVERYEIDRHSGFMHPEE